MRPRVLPWLSWLAVGGAACAGGAPASRPAPPPTATTPPSPAATPAAPPEDGPRLELSRSALSPEGTRIAAWQGMISVGEPAPLCIVHLSSRTAVCATLHSRDQLEDAPRFSSRGTYLVMRTRRGLSVRETAHLHPTFQKDLGKDEQALAVASSPNERLLAWADARGGARARGS